MNRISGKEVTMEHQDPDKEKEIEKVFENYEAKTRRGFLRLIVLRLFYEQVENIEFLGYHGWALIQEIEMLNDDKWKPSPGSIYPLLKEFKENHIIEPTSNESSEDDSNEKITYRITDIGIEVYKRLENLSPITRQRQFFSRPIPLEILREGFKTHHVHRSISELEAIKERFQIFCTILEEMIEEKKKTNPDNDSKLRNQC